MQEQNAYQAIFSVILAVWCFCYFVISAFSLQIYLPKICAPFITLSEIITFSYSVFYVPLSHIFCDKAYHTLLRML